MYLLFILNSLLRFMRHPDEIKKFVKKNGTYMLKKAKVSQKSTTDDNDNENEYSDDLVLNDLDEPGADMKTEAGGLAYEENSNDSVGGDLEEEEPNENETEEENLISNVYSKQETNRKGNNRQLNKLAYGLNKRQTHSYKNAAISKAEENIENEDEENEYGGLAEDAPAESGDVEDDAHFEEDYEDEQNKKAQLHGDRYESFLKKNGKSNRNNEYLESDKEQQKHNATRGEHKLKEAGYLENGDTSSASFEKNNSMLLFNNLFKQLYNNGEMGSSGAALAAAAAAAATVASAVKAPENSSDNNLNTSALQRLYPDSIRLSDLCQYLYSSQMVSQLTGSAPASFMSRTSNEDSNNPSQHAMQSRGQATFAGDSKDSRTSSKNSNNNNSPAYISSFKANNNQKLINETIQNFENSFNLDKHHSLINKPRATPETANNSDSWTHKSKKVAKTTSASSISRSEYESDKKQPAQVKKSPSRAISRTART
jgi:hypothetical protein